VLYNIKNINKLHIIQRIIDLL